MYIYNAVIIKKYIEIFDTILLSFYFIYIALAPLIEKSLTQLLSNIDTLWISNFILWGSLMTYNYCSWCIINYSGSVALCFWVLQSLFIFYVPRRIKKKN